jgi:hypothetical protein
MEFLLIQRNLKYVLALNETKFDLKYFYGPDTVTHHSSNKGGQIEETSQARKYRSTVRSS